MRRLLFILLITINYSSYGQKASREKSSSFLTKFPFKQLNGGVILVQAKFDSINQPLNFILDTGSGAISLDSTTAIEFHIPHTPSGRSINGIAGVA